MPPKQINPDTNRPIKNVREFYRVAREMAGLPYDMDDPERPFTEEYDTPPSAVEPPPEPEQPHPLQEKVERIKEKLAAKHEAEAAQGEDEREDAWASLGSGHNTYQQEGFLPTGRSEDIITTVARSRGGKLVHRVEVAGKFIDVPVSEQASNVPQIEDAKERLLHGQGTPVKSLRRRRK